MDIDTVVCNPSNFLYSSLTMIIGKYYLTYNHSDSYPEDLGVRIVKVIPTDSATFASALVTRISTFIVMMHSRT